MNFLFSIRYWPVIDNAIKEAAYDRGIQVQMLMSNWTHMKSEMIPMLKSLQDFGKSCQHGNITVVSNSVIFLQSDHTFMISQKIC